MHDESWGDQEIVAEAGEPILIGQIQVGQNFGNARGGAAIRR